MAQTKDALTLRYGTKDGHQNLYQPLAASVSIYSGTIALTNASGLAHPATSVATTDTCWGLFNGLFNGTPTVSTPIVEGTTAGVDTIGIDTGTFWLTPGISGDAITQANVGQLCYVIDEVTVGATSGGGTRPVAGRVIQIGLAQYSGYVAVLLGNNQSTGSP
jgi:hypothetical protein